MTEAIVQQIKALEDDLEADGMRIEEFTNNIRSFKESIARYEGKIAERQKSADVKRSMVDFLKRQLASIEEA